MTAGLRPWALSALVHLLLMGGGTSIGLLLERQEPMAVDLGMLGGGGGQGTGPAAQGTPDAGARSKPVPGVRSIPPSPPAVQAETGPDALVSTNATAAPIEAPMPAPSGKTGSAGNAGSGTEAAAGLGTGKGTGTGPGIGTGSGSGVGSGSGSSMGSGADVLGAIYRNEQFAYIRDRIARNLTYPAEAVRSGRTGKVRVAFVIMADGTVDEVRITSSSGSPLLDREVVETVRRVAPFPKPPVSARIEIPVGYTLE